MEAERESKEVWTLCISRNLDNFDYGSLFVWNTVYLLIHYASHESIWPNLC